jgi:chromosome segregation ATPase
VQDGYEVKSLQKQLADKVDEIVSLKNQIFLLREKPIVKIQKEIRIDHSEIDRLNAEIQVKDEQIRRLEGDKRILSQQIAEKDTRIGQLASRPASEDLTELNSALADKTAAAKALGNEIDELNKVIEAQNSGVLQNPFLQARIGELEDELRGLRQRKQTQISDLKLGLDRDYAARLAEVERDHAVLGEATKT